MGALPAVASQICSALAQSRKQAKRQLILCSLPLADLRPADTLASMLRNVGLEIIQNDGWAPMSEVLALAEDTRGVEGPSLAIRSRLDYFSMEGESVPELLSRLNAEGLVFSSAPWRSARPGTFPSSHADILHWLYYLRLAPMQLGIEEGLTWRDNWRSTSLRAKTQRSKRRPRLGDKKYSYDWEQLAAACEITQADALVQISGYKGELAVWFEAVDAGVYIQPRGLVRLERSLPECDLYFAPYPEPSWTIAFTHEPGYGPYLSEVAR